jgi:protein O-GlcNAc transferase
MNPLVIEGLKFHKQGNLLEAKKFYELALKANSNDSDASCLMGMIEYKNKSYEVAINLFKKSINIQSNFFEAYYNLSCVLKDVKRFEEAMSFARKSTEINPSSAEAHRIYGDLLLELKYWDDAIVSYEMAIKINPNNANIYFSLGYALSKIDKNDMAISSYDKAIEINSLYAEAFDNRGNVLKKIKRYNEALANYKKAIEIKPDFALAYSNRASVLIELRMFNEAIADCRRAIELQPGLAIAYSNLSAAFYFIGQINEALSFIKKSIKLDPNRMLFLINIINLLDKLEKFQESADYCKKVLKINPYNAEIFSKYLHIKTKMCDWNHLSENIEKLKKIILEKKQYAVPLTLLSLIDDQCLHLTNAKIYTEKLYPETSGFNFDIKKQSKKIRIGYYSSDFRNHATSYLMEGFLKSHDTDEFDFFGFYLSSGESRNNKDIMTEKISNYFSKFIDVGEMDSVKIIKLSKELQIDIAIDLNGSANIPRQDIFAGRCAPIQVNFLGYPGTMGAHYMDYIIADKIIVPKEEQRNFVEKIAYMPNSYQPNSIYENKISNKIFTKVDENLPKNSFVFCCFNGNHKILPNVFDSWMRILKAVDGSVMWLLETSSTSQNNLQAEASSRGIDPNRLIFCQRLKHDEHLARQKLADLFLDTAPYNAHTTASDSLMVGLPLITCFGQSFASRVSASILNAIEMPELITSNQKEYEKLAIELALNPNKLIFIKQKLEEKIKSAPLFNEKLFAKNIETLYVKMFNRYAKGIGPGNIEVNL